MMLSDQGMMLAVKSPNVRQAENKSCTDKVEYFLSRVSSVAGKKSPKAMWYNWGQGASTMAKYHCPNCGRFCKPNRNSDGTCGACLPPLHDEEHRMKQREELAEHMTAHKRVLDNFFGGLL